MLSFEVPVCYIFSLETLEMLCNVHLKLNRGCVLGHTQRFPKAPSAAAPGAQQAPHNVRI